MNQVLHARVKAVNNANKYAHQLYASLVPIFTPFVGQKITKADGGLLAKIAKLLPELPSTSQLHVYKLTSDYSLAWVVQTCEVVNNLAHYHETVVYIAHMQNGVLEKLYDPFAGRTDYTVDEVKAKREDYDAKKRAAADAFSALYPFGERD